MGPGASGHHRQHRPTGRHNERGSDMALLLWIGAVILAVLGVIALLGGNIIWGIVLLVAAALVGPGGYSIFGRRTV